MSIDLSKEDAKAMAKILRKAISEVSGKHYQPSHSHALEILARTLGYGNWDTFCGMTTLIAVPDFKPFTLFIDAYACDDWAESPNWVKIKVTPSLVQSILENQALAKNGRREIQVEAKTEAWDLDAVYPLDSDTLSVTDSIFWFSTYPKHGKHKWESRPIAIANLLVLAGVTQGTLFKSAWLRLGDFAFYSHAHEAVGLAELLVNDEQLPQATYEVLDAYYAENNIQSSKSD